MPGYLAVIGFWGEVDFELNEQVDKGKGIKGIGLINNSNDFHLIQSCLDSKGIVAVHTCEDIKYIR